jgi:DNA-binding XRE family transcriptional regulator
MVNRETRCPQHPFRLTRLWILTLEPERLESRPAIAGDESRDRWILDRRSSCLLFQMFGVETHSFLPNQQSDRRDLARQGKTRHRRFHPSGRVLGSLRQSAKLSQDQLADRSNLHRTYISQLERGLKSPSLNAIAALAMALNLPAHALIRATEEKKH